MQVWNHYIAGMTDVWLVLIVSLCLLVVVTARLVRTWSSQRPLWRVAKDESGATYMLPLVLVMPFYVLLITMIIECTLMLSQKIGSVGAAYSAARAAAVWLPYESAMPKEAPDYTPLADRQTMVRLAAARAMWPYASGAKYHATQEPLGTFLEQTIEQQIAVFETYSGDTKFDKEYLKRKFAYAYNGSTIEMAYLDPVTLEVTKDPAFNAKIQLTLRYEAPIHTSGIGRLFGERSQLGNYFVRPCVTTVMMENEGVKVAAASRPVVGNVRHGKSLGIAYYSRLIANIPERPSSYGILGGISDGASAAGRQISNIPPGMRNFIRFAEHAGNIADLLEALMGSVDTYRLIQLGQYRSALITLFESAGSGLGSSIGVRIAVRAALAVAPYTVLFAAVAGSAAGDYAGRHVGHWIAVGIANTFNIQDQEMTLAPANSGVRLRTD